MVREEAGKRVVLRFLEDYKEFGSRGHLVAVQALQAKIAISKDDDEKKLLAIKVYNEFMASLEDLAALCIAVRHRDDGVGLMYAYLTYGRKGKEEYPSTRLADIYEIAVQGRGLSAALNLPPLEQIIERDPKLSDSLLPRLYEEVNKLLAMAGKIYLLEEGSLVRVYNKTKHGFVIVKDQNIFEQAGPKVVPEAGWIVTENPKYQPGERTGQSVVELNKVEVKSVDKMVQRITSVRGAVVTICELVRFLLEFDIISSADNKA